MSSLTKHRPMPNRCSSGLSLSGHRRCDTQVVGAGHTHGWRGQRLHETQSWLAPLPAPSLPGQCRIGTQRLAARHTRVEGDMVETAPTGSSSLPPALLPRPPGLRYPSCWRRAHSQGEGPDTPRHPRQSRPSPCTHSVQPSRSRYPVQQRWTQSQGKPLKARHPLNLRFPETPRVPPRGTLH